VSQLTDGSGWPLAAVKTLVSESIDVVRCPRASAGPRVTEVALAEDLQSGLEASQFTVTAVFRRRAADQPLAWTGNPQGERRLVADTGHDGRRLLHEPRPPVRLSGGIPR
jgi:hypothetical protein